MSSARNLVIRTPGGLRTPVSITTRWKPVAEIVSPTDLGDSDATLSNLILQPQLAELKMSYFVKAPPLGASDCGARINAYFKILEQRNNPYCLWRSSRCAVIFGLARR